MVVLPERLRLLPPLLLLPILVATEAAPMNVTAVDIERSVIYHSPQRPGYTCWASVWQMPDGVLRVAFHQATGPSTGRPGGRRDVLAALGWPPPGRPAYDMTGTTQQVVTIESRDSGRTWAPFSTEPFHTPMNGFLGSATALPDGSVLRTVWGMYLPFYDVPQAGYLQRSTDGGKTWGPPILLADPAQAVTLPKRVKVLRDGRVLVSGGYCPLGEGVTGFRQSLGHLRAALWLSKDGGATWSEPVLARTAKDGAPPTEESDVAELADGRLLLINRSDGPPARWQSVLKPAGESYLVESTGAAPFPHSGEPDVLAVREGLVLHLATSNVSWTADAGKTWHDLGLGTEYYPASLQLPDGRIFTAAHHGSDDPYDGSVDQDIRALTFRLKIDP